MSFQRSGDPNFSLSELVDWDSVQLPDSQAAAINEEIAAADIPGDHLSPADFQAADMVKDSADYGGEDPIEFAGLFEGDIENVVMDDLRASAEGRNAIRDEWRKWPGASIPYVISSTFSKNERSVIARAMKKYHEKTCIRFKPRTSERAYIHIMKVDITSLYSDHSTSSEYTNNPVGNILVISTIEGKRVQFQYWADGVQAAGQPRLRLRLHRHRHARADACLVGYRLAMPLLQ